MNNDNQTVVGGRPLRVERGREGRQELNRPEEIIGDSCTTKSNDCLRLMSQNINGLGQDSNSIKEQGLKKFIEEYKIDVMAIQQVNVCWSKVSYNNKIWERFRRWRQSHNLSVAYDMVDKNTKPHQTGGVATISTGKISHTWVSSGYDDRKLGRWSWVRYQGSYGRHLRVISIYRPCLNTHLVSSVYMKQYVYSLREREGKCPRELFLEDLYEEIFKWKNMGDGIVIMGDFNQDVRSSEIQEWKERLGLEDKLLDRVEGEGRKLNTYSGGNVPIDTIMCTQGIEVLKAGYLPFGEGVGDHRPIYIDITVASSLGVNLPNPITMKARRLKTNDPRITNRYNKILKSYFTKVNLPQRVRALQDRITQPLNDETAQEYEKLDKIRIEAMQYAEKNCRKLPMGGIPWTPELSKIRHTIEVWQLVKKRLKGHKVSARTILRKKIKAGIGEIETNVPLNFANSQVRSEYKKYKEYLLQASLKRQNFQEELAQARANEGKTSIVKEIERMKRVETQRDSARRIRKMNGTLRQNKGLPKVMVQDLNGDEIEIVEKEAMEKALLDSYEKTLTQSNTTPCMQSPLIERLGLCATTETAVDILMGNAYNEDGIDESTKEVLKFLAMKEGMRKHFMPKSLEVAECQSGWKKVRERTCSSMKNGVHFGHWMTGYTDLEIATTHTELANIPYTSGYAPLRWRVGTNSIIPKELGNYNIKRLRTILLYEADFNFNNKILAKRMMHIAEDENILAPEQYGSRNKMSAIECALNKRLMFDILRQTKKPAGICSCDLHSCYDRVVHSFASLAMQRAGAPASAIASMFGTLQKLKHTVRTCYGESEQTFGGEPWREVDPLHGVGQGNGAGPAIWAVISTVFFDLLRSKGYGFKLQSPLSHIDIHLAGCGFVDDTDLLQIGSTEEDYTAVAQSLQEALHWWETCTKVSGGAVVPHKSWFGLVDFEWNEGEWSYNNNMDNVTLRVTDKDGVDTSLDLLQPHDAKRMLGVFLAMDGSNDVQVTEMRKAAASWYDKVRTGHMTRYDAWQALRSTIMKKLEYPLLALTLTKEECNKIMSPILMGTLPRMGVCRTMARALVYTPIKYQGLGVDELYITQGLQHVKALLDHIWRESTTGKLLIISLEYLKLEVGIQGSILTEDYELYGHLAEESWVAHTWKFLTDVGLQIKDELRDFPLVRNGDSTLSAMFAKACIQHKITKREWYKANKCRIYLKVLTLGDIVTADGTAIEENTLKGIFNKCRARKLEWPVQQRPKDSEWRIWRKVLKISVLDNTSGLRLQLNAWTINTDTIYEQAWDWWLDNENNTLYKYYDGIWTKFTPEMQRRRRRTAQQRYRSYIVVDEAPDRNYLHRTSVRFEKGYYIARGYHTQLQNDNGLQNIREDESTDSASYRTDVLQQVIDALEDRIGEQWALKEILTTDCIDEIVRDINKGTAVAVSDGSFKGMGGTAAWIIENESGSQRIMGVVNVPGTVLDQSAYRSEIAGIYGSVLVIETIKDTLKLDKGGITIGCDGKNALEQAVLVKDNVLSCQQQHFDLLSGIQGYIKDSCLTYIPKHIKGHQDDVKSYENLDRFEVLNVEADFNAKQYWIDKYGDKDKLPPCMKYKIPKGMWEISLLGVRLCKQLLGSLRESIQVSNAFEYWVERKKRFTNENFGDVDWDANKIAMKSVSNTRRQWVTKFQAGLCGTGRMMKRWKQRVIDNCPRCGAENETTTHVLQCQSESATAIWNKSVQELDTRLKDIRTCPDLRKLLLNIINKWRSGEEVQNVTPIEFESCEGIFAAQKKIGWRNMIGGCFANEWSSAQEEYYKWLGMRRTGERWVAEVIKRLWDISWDLWQDRNDLLHKTSRKDILSGVATLDAAIIEECQLGNEGLPRIVRDTFPIDIEELLQAPLIHKKSWFVLVRTARELIHDNRIQNEFTDPQSHLRTWVGME